MITTTRLRILRLKHGISLEELAEKAEISNQHLSRLELAQIRGTARQEERMNRAMVALIQSRNKCSTQLILDYLDIRGRLLEPLEVEADEQ